jgi:branched-chain amino acid transport system permease protein
MKRLALFANQGATSSRLVGVLLLTLLTLAITFVLPPVADSQLASGAAISIVVLGLSWLIGWSGQISLGNSGFMAVGAYATGIWAHHHASSPIIFTFVLAMAVGAFSGLIIAIPSTRLRGPYLAGMTLAFSAAIAPLAQNYTSITGGEGGLFFNTLTTPHWF